MLEDRDDDSGGVRGVGKDGCSLRRAKFEEFKSIQAGYAIENEKY